MLDRIDVENDPVNFVDPLGFGKIGTTVRISKRVWKHIRNKHIRGTTGSGTRFSGDESGVRGLIEKTIDGKPDGTYIDDIGNTIGTDGETAIKYVIKDGALRTAYPVPGANLGGQLGGFLGVPLAGDLLDFFNPLSDLQDILDLLCQLTGTCPCEEGGGADGGGGF